MPWNRQFVYQNLARYISSEPSTPNFIFKIYKILGCFFFSQAEAYSQHGPIFWPFLSLDVLTSRKGIKKFIEFSTQSSENVIYKQIKPHLKKLNN